MNREQFEKMLRNYHLTTANILYHMPDHPKILQTYIWQELDINPDFPVLKKFLNFWERSLDGKLHSVTVVSCGILKPSDFRFNAGEFYLN